MKQLATYAAESFIRIKTGFKADMKIIIAKRGFRINSSRCDIFRNKIMLDQICIRFKIFI